MESPDVIPIIVLRVENLAHCQDCPRDLREALQRMDGTHEVQFDSEYKKVFIRSTLDPLMVIKKIAKMNKSAELIFYDKEPFLEDHNHKNPSSSREKHPCRDEDNQNARHNGKERKFDFPEDDPCRKENGHERDAEQLRKNARENGAEKYHCCRDYHDAPQKEDGHKSDDERYKQNFSKKNSSYRDYDDVHKDQKNQYCTQNIREDGLERPYRCRINDRSDTKDGVHGTSSDNKKPNMFFDDDIFKTFSKRRSAFWGRYMPSRENGTMFENYNDPDHFRSRSCRYDPRNSQHRYNGPCTSPYEHCNSTMPPSYEHHHSTMPPPPPPPPPPPTSSYYSNFSDENPNGCIIT